MAHRDDADALLAVRDDRRPVLAAYHAHNQKSRFIRGSRGDFDQIRIVPECLRLPEVDPVFQFVGP